MVNPRLAARYAKSLLDIGVESNTLENLREDVVFFRQVIAGNPDLKALLRSPIIKADKKQAVLQQICQGRVSHTMQLFLQLLTSKGREKVFPEILSAFMDQYNELKGIHHVKITTAQPLSEAMQAELLNKFKKDTGIEHVELETVVKENIIGGFILDYDNKVVDASIARDLRDIRRQFLDNQYIFNIR